MMARAGWLVMLVGVLAAFSAVPAMAQREFRPPAQGQVYEKEFLADFWDALGCRPEGLSWVEESETVRLLVTAGSMCLRGDTTGALRTLDLIPSNIASSFPFLATMREDLLVPRVLEPWYADEEARSKLFQFYRETWLPHPEYRDDFRIFRDDTAGRASRIDQSVPAVWILANLDRYGFVPGRDPSADEPYLFLWDLLTQLAYYAQRANYYGQAYDRYDPDLYKGAVLGRVGEIIRAAHDEAARREMARGFWGSLLDRYQPFAPASPGAEEMPAQPVAPVQTPSGQQQTQPQPAEVPQRPAETAQSAGELFRVPGETRSTEEKAEIETLISELMRRLSVPEVPEQPSQETAAGVSQTPQVPAESPPARSPEPVPSSEPGREALGRLGEIAGELVDRIGVLAEQLGQEAIDLVVLYNDVNVSQETIRQAEGRYIDKREAFLAGLGVWDRFKMEIYSELTLEDFNALIISRVRAPYEMLKRSDTQWAQYRAFESKFESAFSQIETGIRNRRDDPDVIASEETALTNYLPDYISIIREVENLLSEAAEPAG